MASAGPLVAALALGVAALSPDAATDGGKAASETATNPLPPRVDGPWVGFVAHPTIGLVRVRDLNTDGAFAGAGGAVSVGETVLPWLGIGLQIGGAYAVRSEQGVRQQLGHGALMVDFRFLPVPRVPLSVRTSFGLGGGAVTQAGVPGRSGYGGAVFGGAVRYEIFPGVARYRPHRAGGFGLGPELGWIGATPTKPGRPMANLFYLGLSGTFYFGR